MTLKQKVNRVDWRFVFVGLLFVAAWMAGIMFVIDLIF